MYKNGLAYMESFFMALADKTRLRLLNLMQEEEVCVCFFTEVLGDSQPKISRHLAYLRKAGIVRARRDGKWMHYSIVEPEEPGARQVLDEVFAWLEGQADMRSERDRYRAVCCSPEALVQIARTPMPFIAAVDADEDAEHGYEERRSSHNELEEFLL